MHGPGFCSTIQGFTAAKLTNELARNNAAKWDRQGANAEATFQDLPLAEQQSLLRCMLQTLVGAKVKRSDFKMADGVLALHSKVGQFWPLTESFMQAVLAAGERDLAAVDAAAGPSDAATGVDALGAGAAATGQSAGPCEQPHPPATAQGAAEAIKRREAVQSLLQAGSVFVKEAVQLSAWTSKTGMICCRSAHAKARAQPAA